MQTKEILKSLHRYQTKFENAQNINPAIKQEISQKITTQIREIEVGKITRQEGTKFVLELRDRYFWETNLFPKAIHNGQSTLEFYQQGNNSKAMDFLQDTIHNLNPVNVNAPQYIHRQNAREKCLEFFCRPDVNIFGIPEEEIKSLVNTCFNCHETSIEYLLDEER